MHKVTVNAVEAFVNNTKFTRHNTRVVPGLNTTRMFVGKNRIATKIGALLFVQVSNFHVIASVNRLKGLGVKVTFEDSVLKLNGKLWNGRRRWVRNWNN